LQFSAAEIAHQLESADECNKLIVKKAVLIPEYIKIKIKILKIKISK
jgi:hypothetical protein